MSLAYIPGVAVPCLKTKDYPDASFEYTSQGNLVGVITNGTAVLGWATSAPWPASRSWKVRGCSSSASPIWMCSISRSTSKTPTNSYASVKSLEPIFGGLNLEDIYAPDCFYIEQKLSQQMSIPVFHDDQHGTAIISAAGLINACHLTGRKLKHIRVVINGAGAAAIASVKMYVRLGVKKDNITMVDSTGVVHRGREKGMNPYKELFALGIPNAP